MTDTKPAGKSPPPLTEAQCAGLYEMVVYNTRLTAMTNAELVDESLWMSDHLPLNSKINDCLAELYSRIDPTWTERKHK